MNIRDLKYIVTVAELQHFGKAAEICCVSQPTLSAQIKKVEDELGIVIFERSNKQFLITDIGHEIITQAHDILNKVSELKVIADQSKDPFAGKFRLGIIPTLGPYLTPLFIPKIKQQLPKLSLSISEDKTENILHELRCGALDAIVLALPVENQGLAERELFKEPFYVALPRDHYLTQSKEISIKDLNDETLLLLSEGHCLSDQALEVCQSVGIKRDKALQATSLETLRHIVSTGAGITLLPHLALPKQKESLTVIKPFKKPYPNRIVGMLWRKQHVRQATSQRIADIIQQAALEHLP